MLQVVVITEFAGLRRSKKRRKVQNENCARNLE